jgi:hypothetical protein
MASSLVELRCWLLRPGHERMAPSQRTATVSGSTKSSRGVVSAAVGLPARDYLFIYSLILHMCSFRHLLLFVLCFNWLKGVINSRRRRPWLKSRQFWLIQLKVRLHVRLAMSCTGACSVSPRPRVPTIFTLRSRNMKLIVVVFHVFK